MQKSHFQFSSLIMKLLLLGVVAAFLSCAAGKPHKKPMKSKADGKMYIGKYKKSKK